MKEYEKSYDKQILKLREEKVDHFQDFTNGFIWGMVILGVIVLVISLIK